MDNQTRFQQMLDVVKHTHKSSEAHVFATLALIENSDLTYLQKMQLKYELLGH